jgi:hypothetical protein
MSELVLQHEGGRERGEARQMQSQWTQSQVQV